MSSPRTSLVRMGFSDEDVDKALAATGGSDTQAAMEWLLARPEDPGSSGEGHTLGGAASASPVPEAGGGAEPEPPLQARSLKCDDCGRLFKSELDAQAHAARTQHSNFSESVEEVQPPTEEEKAAQAQRLQEKLKQKRAERLLQEKKDLVEREKIRRRTGKEISDARQQHELMEAKKIADQKRREKLEEKRARDKVREDIARDRAEREAQQRRTKELPAPVAAEPVSKPAVKKEYDSCRLQVRLFGGGTLMHTFKAEATLVEVMRHIMMTQPGHNEPFVLMTSFPRHVFSAEDSPKTLKELGLVPSAVLIQTKP